MKNIKKMALAGLFLAALGFTACQKSRMSPLDTETILATDNARMDNESDNVGSLVNAIATSNGIGNIGGKLEGGGIFGNINLPECATVTLDTVSNPKSIIVDFGNSPCLCDEWDGRYRQGAVKATWTGPYLQAGTVITITTTDYFRGDLADQMNQYDINRTVTNMGPNVNGNMQFHLVGVVNVTFYTGETANWNVDKLKEWTQGAATVDPNDDVMVITGGVTGTNRNGIAVAATITTPIVKNSCEWYVSGIVEITRASLPKVVLDYGNGTCDDLATITVNGQTKTITLK